MENSDKKGLVILGILSIGGLEMAGFPLLETAVLGASSFLLVVAAKRQYLIKYYISLKNKYSSYKSSKKTELDLKKEEIRSEYNNLITKHAIFLIESNTFKNLDDCYDKVLLALEKSYNISLSDKNLDIFYELCVKHYVHVATTDPTPTLAPALTPIHDNSEQNQTLTDTTLSYANAATSTYANAATLHDYYYSRFLSSLSESESILTIRGFILFVRKSLMLSLSERKITEMFISFKYKAEKDGFLEKNPLYKGFQPHSSHLKTSKKFIDK